MCSQLPALIWATVQSLGCHQGKGTVTAGDCGYCSYKINNLPLAFTASTQSYPLNRFGFFSFLFLSWLSPQKRFQSRSNRNAYFLCHVLCETWTQNSHWQRGGSYVWRCSHAFLSFFLSKKALCMKLNMFFSSESLAPVSSRVHTMCFVVWRMSFLAAPLWPPVTSVVLSIPSNMFACVFAEL